MRLAFLNLCLALLVPTVSLAPTSVEGQIETAVEISQRLLREIQQNGGVTYQPLHRRTPTKGYVVSTFKAAERAYNAGVFTAADIGTFLFEHRAKFRDSNVHVGGWVDGGKVYLDLSRVVPDRTEAMRLGMAHEQRAIFHLNTLESIPVRIDP